MFCQCAGSAGQKEMQTKLLILFSKNSGPVGNGTKSHENQEVQLVSHGWWYRHISYQPSSTTAAIVYHRWLLVISPAMKLQLLAIRHVLVTLCIPRCSRRRLWRKNPVPPGMLAQALNHGDFGAVFGSSYTSMAGSDIPKLDINIHQLLFN